MYQDTIAAISTPLGEGGIGIVRLSGEKAREIGEKLFTRPLAERRLVYGYIVDPETAETVDEVLVVFLPAPHTYTREDVIEINCHGGAVALQRILALALRYGARAAEPGEFTLRAFLNGRIDLAQAEAVLEIVQAKTQASLRLAVEGLKGRLSTEIRAIRNDLLSVLAYLTARIDFPEDEIEEQDALAPIRASRQAIQKLIATADSGMVYRYGIRTAIVGRPNVGKSSLLNRLLGENRAIVTPIPGTTRDTLEEVLNLRGVPFVLVDTAGITQSADLVESLGIERSYRAIQQAALVLWVLDLSEPLTQVDGRIRDLLEGRTVLAVANKSDLPPRADLGDIPFPVVHISALTGAGLLGEAQKSLEANMPDDFVTVDLSAALTALGEITGESVTEELLETIFSRFCVGK